MRDITIIEAEPAGLFAAYELITKNPKLKVTIVSDWQKHLGSDHLPEYINGLAEYLTNAGNDCYSVLVIWHNKRTPYGVHLWSGCRRYLQLFRSFGDWYKYQSIFIIFNLT